MVLHDAGDEAPRPGREWRGSEPFPEPGAGRRPARGRHAVRSSDAEGPWSRPFTSAAIEPTSRACTPPVLASSSAARGRWSYSTPPILWMPTSRKNVPLLSGSGPRSKTYSPSPSISWAPPSTMSLFVPNRRLPASSVKCSENTTSSCRARRPVRDGDTDGLAGLEERAAAGQRERHVDAARS